MNRIRNLEKSIDNVTPSVEVKSRRVGGATYQIPSPVRDGRKESLAMKWLISFAKAEMKKQWLRRLAGEIFAASKEEGAAYKKKEDTHKNG